MRCVQVVRGAQNGPTLVLLLLVAGRLNVGLLRRLLLQLLRLGGSFGQGGGATGILGVFDSVAHGLELDADLGDRVDEGLVLRKREGDALRTSLLARAVSRRCASLPRGLIALTFLPGRNSPSFS